VHVLYEGDLELVRAYEVDVDADVETMIATAVEEGDIGVGSVETWRRSFETAPELARDTLESAQPDMHRRMDNRLAEGERPLEQAGDRLRHLVVVELDAAGPPVPRIERPAGLTDREAEVVGLLARGLQAKHGDAERVRDLALFAMQHGLGTSPRHTCGCHHVQRAYRKHAVRVSSSS
jgi:hypothetical protein